MTDMVCNVSFFRPKMDEVVKPPKELIFPSLLEEEVVSCIHEENCIYGRFAGFMRNI